MKDLEKIVREKFALGGEAEADFEARHPFKEEYWKAAEQLILADERRRHAIWWWWLAATAGVLFGGYFLFKNWAAQRLPSEPVAQNQIENFSKNELRKAATPTEQQQNLLNNSPQSTNQPINQPEVISKNSPVIVVHDIRKVAGADEKSVSGNDTEVALVSPPNPLKEEPSEQNLEAKNKAQNEVSKPTEINSPFRGWRSEFWATQKLQPIDFQKLEKEKPQPQKVYFQPIVKKHEPKTWHFGAVGAVQWQAEKNNFGGSAGAFLQKKFTEKWSVFTEMKLRQRPDEGASKTSEQVKYDFGVAIKKYQLTRKSAFWLEMPLGFQFSKTEKLAFQFGIAPAVLLASRGVLAASEKPSTTFEYRNTASEQVWLDDADYRKFYLSPFLGAELRLNRTFAAYLRANFQPQNLELNNETSGLATPKIGVEVGAKINLK